MHNQDLGDYIGAESCVDFKPDAVGATPHGAAGTNHRRRQLRRDAAAKKYPPAIPSLESQPLMQVMKKYITSDGRIVIREERVKRRELFQAHRSDGRLLLNLVPIDGDEEKALDSPENVEINGGDDSNRFNGIGVNPCGGYAVEGGGVSDGVLV